jgi:hypothetical protein
VSQLEGTVSEEIHISTCHKNKYGDVLDELFLSETGTFLTKVLSKEMNDDVFQNVDEGNNLASSRFQFLVISSLHIQLPLLIWGKKG